MLSHNMPTPVKRPIAITILACVYLWIGCGGTVFFPIIAFAGGVTSLWQLIAGDTVHSPLAFKISGYLFGTLWYLGYIAYAAAGFGLWKLRNWARKLVIAINLFFSSAALIVAPLLSRPLLLGIPIALVSVIPFVAIVWYMRRPRVRYAFGDLQLLEGTGPDTLPGIRTKTAIVWILGGAVCAFALFFFCVFALVEVMMHASGGYKLALDRVNKSPCAVAVLGSPIRAGWNTTGDTNENGPNGTANLTIPVTGPKGKASLDLEAKKAEGVWEINSLKLDTDSDELQIVPAGSACQ
jgi:hypothetical protein